MLKTPLLALCFATLTSLCLGNALDHSLSLEVKRALKKGQAYLLQTQSEQGYWGEPETPALTGLAVSAIIKGPSLNEQSAQQVRKALDFLTSNQKPDGGIYADEGLLTYNTALSITAMSEFGDPADKETILKARRFLVSQQREGNVESGDEPFAGGIGYGNSYSHSDLSNTYLALEALKKSEAYLTETDQEPRLDWDAALAFVSRAQNLTETNDQEWASNDAENKGGFVYFPGNSKAGEVELENGKIALRSYGSISYAGLMSLIYADLGVNDPRVKAVKEWISKNYTLDENPGMGLQGLYYYYQAMAKSLNAAGMDQLILEDGTTVAWRDALGSRLVQTQKPDGSWANENARWWETDPLLVTAYVMISLSNL